MSETRKDRIEERIRQAGYSNTSDFLRKMVAEAKVSSNPYEYYQKNKGNYNRAIQGERTFKEEEIVAIEKLLSTSFYDLLSGEAKTFIPKGIRFAAYRDDPVLLGNGKDADGLVREFDEYDRTLLDYILEFKSKNLFSYIVKNHYLQMSLDLGGYTYCGFSVQSSSNRRIVELALSCGDEEVFDTLYPAVPILSRISNHQEWIFDEDFFRALIADQNILSRFVRSEPMSVKLKEINPGLQDDGSGYFVHPLIMILFSRYLYLLRGNEARMELLLSRAIRRNSEIIDQIEKFHISYTDLTAEGLIRYGRTTVASIYTCNIEEDAEFSRPDIAYSIEKMNAQSNQLKFSSRELLGGLSGRKARIENGRLVKMSSGNQTEYDFLRLMKESGFSLVPEYCGTEDGLDRFTFVPGAAKLFVTESPRSEIEQVIDALKGIQEISRKALGGKVYVHGDLSPMNVCFFDGKLTGIIDWDSCYVGEDYYDFIYVFWTWANLGRFTRNNDSLFDDLLWMIDRFNPSDEFKSCFADKMISVMESRLEGMSKDNPQYSRIYQWVKWSETWVELYREKITERIG